jgi:MoaA/NifB/PqqE/SkfB family radical SAM enzyme
MTAALFHRLIPASLYGGGTAFPILSRGCDHTSLYAPLRVHFDEAAAQALTLKILNIRLAGNDLKARRSSALCRPLGIVADPSNVCRLACPGCVHSVRSEALKRFIWPNGTLSEERFSALLKLYGPYAIGVYFCNYGEPLLNLNTPKLIRLAKSYLMGAMLSTSLSVERFDPEAYVESGLDSMVVSIDGATQEVYGRFRRNGNLELALDNLRRLVEAKRRLKKRTPVVSWNFLAFQHNAHEIRPAMRMARKLGVNQFRVVRPFDVTWDDPEIVPAAVRPRIRRFDWFSTTNLPENWNPFPKEVDAETIGRAFERPLRTQPENDEPPSPGHTCHWLYKNIVMDATGRILPCCAAPRPEADLVFSDINAGDEDPFNSEKYRRARACFRDAAFAGAAVFYCSRCEWDHATVNIGNPEIRRYFRAADPAFFDHRSLRLLAT